MKKSILVAAGAVAVLAAGTAAQAKTVVFDFSLAPHQNNLGTTEVYTVAGLTITASGFNQLGAATDLWGKHGSGDEKGLGLANDPTGDHEIHYQSGFVQLDLSALRGLVHAVTFGTNSTTGGEAWTVYATNTAGSYAGGLVVATGSTEVLNQALTGFETYKYFDFVETGTGGGKNFLITRLTATAPEPSSWALMLLGFGGIGGMVRKHRLTLAV